MAATKIINYKWTTEMRPNDLAPIWPFVNEPVDLIFADPPYNYGVKYKDDETRDKLPPEEYRALVEATLFKLSKMVKPGGTLWWLCPAEAGDWVWQAIHKYGWLLYGKPIIWYERFSQYQQKRLTSDYRLLFPLIGGGQTKATTFNPDDIRVKSVRQLMGDPRANPDGRVPGHLWVVSRLQGNAAARVDWHTAQLGPGPLETIVQGWTNPGDTVLDAFAGSGSLGVVCKALGRDFVGIDGSATYCKLMRQRLKEAPSAK